MTNVMKCASDLAVLWIYCQVSVIFIPVDVSFVTADAAAVIYGCGSCLAHTGWLRRGMTGGFLALSVVCPSFLIFMPIAFYILLDEVEPSDGEDMVDCGLAWGDDGVDKRRYVLAAAAGCLGTAFFVSFNRALVCFTAVGCVLAWVIQYQTRQYAILDVKFRRTRDDGMEKNLLLREKNQSILKNQDYEIYTATLKERNRIAREIHDNVGHMLSRSILMVGALRAVHGEGNLKESLCQLEDTLNAAMTSVRASVHDLHDEAVNLKEALENLTGEFTFCQADLKYDMGYDVPREIRYGFIAIVKEALHNVMKHSDATQVRVVAREHPGFYQLIVEDNGTLPDSSPNASENFIQNQGGTGDGGFTLREQEGYRGIGIHNMKERVDTFGGNLKIQTQNGWRIYITVPKKS